MNFVKAIVLILVVTGLTLACTGCTFKTKDFAQNNTSQGYTTQLNVPEYPNANKTSYSKIPVIGQFVTYQTNDTPQQVLEFYKSQMQDQGYNVSRSFTSTNETGGLVIFARGQDTVWVTAGQNQGITDIAVRTSFQS
jgi:hypothetical protein